MKSQNTGKSKVGFTLVELLVAVAIVGILSAIAAVNFQAASVRSKVARVQNDMTTIAGAIEIYRFDRNVYPPAAIGDFQLETPLVSLTTPVEYLSSVPNAPFGPAAMDFNPGIRVGGYNYKDQKTTSVGMPAETYGHIWEAMPRKEYFLHSCGPNLVWDVLPYVEYDPTNGTVSKGDICRFGPM